MSPAFRGSSVLMDTEIQNWLVYNYIISNSRCNCYFLLLLLARDWCVVVELWFLKIKFCLSRTQIKKKGRREELLLLLLLLSSKTYYSAMECGMVNNPASWWVPSSRQCMSGAFPAKISRKTMPTAYFVCCY